MSEGLILEKCELYTTLKGVGVFNSEMLWVILVGHEVQECGFTCSSKRKPMNSNNIQLLHCNINLHF